MNRLARFERLIAHATLGERIVIMALILGRRVWILPWGHFHVIGD